MPELTKEEEYIFTEAIKTRNWDLFTDYFFRLEWSGTWFTPEDRVEQYSVFYGGWLKSGQPEKELEVQLEGIPAKLKVSYDPYYGSYPIFLLHHGFRTLDWINGFLSPLKTKCLAITGRGTGKTAGVAIRALAYCAIMPGFDFLNVAPTQYQADLMLGEIVKWCSNTIFNKFIKIHKSANRLWKEVNNYPVITVNVDGKIDSTFTCQTVGRDARNVIGGEFDWINCDEAGLLTGIEEADPILVTSLRGTRDSGVPRWTKLTWITNPAANVELIALQEKYEKELQRGNKNYLVVEELNSAVNVYLTKRQIEEQKIALTQRQQDRWIAGQMSAAMANSEISEGMLTKCRSQKMTEEMDEIGDWDDDLGLVGFEYPHDKERDYILVGDVGKSPLLTINSQNVPAMMVFDITNFLEEPSTLRAMYWMDGNDTYETFVSKFRYLIFKYKCKGYYDATNIQTAFEEVGGFEDIPFTEPVMFSGTAQVKKWAVAVASLLMQNGLFRWPYIKGLWHQARIFDISSRKNADDLIVCLFVMARAVTLEGTLWTRFVDHFGWDDESLKAVPDKAKGDEEEAAPVEYDRHARVFA